MMLAEGAAQVGAVTITGRPYSADPFFVAASDYTLVGEEIFAGGAYLSKDPVKIGNLAAQDWGKLASMAIIIIGSLMATFIIGHDRLAENVEEVDVKRKSRSP